jgi:cytoskeletal protein CcmA (bactofilin family)
MFGTTKKEAAKAGIPVSLSLNTLTEGTSIEGIIKADSDLRVDGKIKGNLICSAKVIIGPTGQVSGEIRCKNAVIEGKFVGLLEVQELLNIRENAHIEGDIFTGKLVVQSGAVFNVNCHMGANPKKSGQSGALKQQESSIKPSSKDKAVEV